MEGIAAPLVDVNTLFRWLFKVVMGGIVCLLRPSSTGSDPEEQGSHCCGLPASLCFRGGGVFLL